MRQIHVMVNGLPGNMATLMALHVIRDDRCQLVPFSLTGQEITEKEVRVEGITVQLVPPAVRDQAMADIVSKAGPFITVDFSLPMAVNDNASFYCAQGLAFVMGTTGGDRNRLVETVRSSNISAVIAPNMAKQIVGFQAMMAYAADTFPDLFKGYTLDIIESHQKGKVDTSGTAKAMVSYFNRMGLEFSEQDIRKERNPENQKSTIGVPEAHLGGHAWHTYALVSDDRTVRFEFIHNVNGRDVYAKGALDAVVYLNAKIEENVIGRVFSMIDVLKGA